MGIFSFFNRKKKEVVKVNNLTDQEKLLPRDELTNIEHHKLSNENKQLEEYNRKLEQKLQDDLKWQENIKQQYEMIKQEELLSQAELRKQEELRKREDLKKQEDIKRQEEQRFQDDFVEAHRINESRESYSYSVNRQNIFHKNFDSNDKLNMPATGTNYKAFKFDSIWIGLASPDRIRQWSWGEIKKPETINYRTLKPEPEGLFCEKIFGPVKDWECNCGKFKRVRYKGKVCDRCGVEVTKAWVRRERLGHIELAAPVAHIWYFYGIPSRIGLILDINPRALEKVLYFASYIVTESGDTPLYEKQLLTIDEYREALDKYRDRFKAMIGAEAIKALLEKIDLELESRELRAHFEEAAEHKKFRITRKLEIIEAMRLSGNRPEWMILDVLPVMPPDLRPMIHLDSGRFATSDINALYREVINRNNRLKRVLELGGPDIIVRDEKRRLQEAVDALIDNGSRGRRVTGPGNRQLISLSDLLEKKQGQFRLNLLGKRVDYSGISVLVVDPKLRLNQCGLPKKMALELFKPFVMNKLVKEGHTHNIKSAKRMVDRVNPLVWDVLESVIKDHPILLNKTPTLHKIGIQAFDPVLVDGKAIKISPLLFTSFSEDFDRDNLVVHVPISPEAQAEAILLMFPYNNILDPKNGKPIITPSQDMVFGCYYLTVDGKGETGEGKMFKDYNEMFHAYDNGDVGIHARVKVRMKLNKDDRGTIVESTVGRFIFNENIPQDLGLIDREIDKYSLEVDRVVDKKFISIIIEKCFRKHGNAITADVLDHIKELGFKYSTISGISISMKDTMVPYGKPAMIKLAEEEVDKFEKCYKRGLISDEERHEKVIEIWNQTTKEVIDVLMKGLDPMNNIYIMALSGTEGIKNQIGQLSGMRGLTTSTIGKRTEFPVKSNFKEGLSVLQYFESTHGSRKGMIDRAIKTADAGYLTRRLIDVAHGVIIRETDCGTDQYILIKKLNVGKEVLEKLSDRIDGRYSFEDIIHPETGELLVKANTMISKTMADFIQNIGIKEVKVRTVLGCKTEFGVCAHCYGSNLATGKDVNIGEAVGIIAAQSIGEPGTQLTRRTFLTGGVAGVADITQILPRVEELFEARRPKGLAVISELDGVVSFSENKRSREIVITSEEGCSQTYAIVYGSRIIVKPGDVVEAGDEITEGSVNPHDILSIKGVSGVQSYIIKEVQRAYRTHRVDINDKHIEVIVKQMLSKVKIESSGDTNMIPGSLVNSREFEASNKKVIIEGRISAVGKPTLMGITRASLATESFLSAASFQETTRVLTDAAIEGKKDLLQGLKENVIIGRLIPAGTGMKRSKDIVTVDSSTPLDVDDIVDSEDL